VAHADGGGQTVQNSVGTVQVGSANVSPAASANAPVNANAPVTVAGDQGSASATQSGGENTASSSTSTQNETGTQNAQSSIGTVQVGSVDVDPAVAVNAPVNGNAPVCAASDCAGGDASQSTTGSNASTSTSGGQSGDQTTRHSIGTVQIGSVDVNPAVSA